MKHRNRFLKYARPQIDNDVINLTSYAPNAFAYADDGGDGDNGGGEDSSSSDSVTVSQAQLTQMITDGIAAANKVKEDNKNQSAIDKIDAEKNKNKSEAQRIAETRKNLAFDMGFDGFIDKNKKLFTVDVAKFRESANGLDGDALERALSVTAAKDFFRSEENVALLPERDREFVKNNVLNMADNAIDYRKAFQLIEDAIHVKARINEHGHYRNNTNNSSSDDNNDTPNVTAYLKKCADAGKPAAA